MDLLTLPAMGAIVKALANSRGLGFDYGGACCLACGLRFTDALA